MITSKNTLILFASLLVLSTEARNGYPLLTKNLMAKIYRDVDVLINNTLDNDGIKILIPGIVRLIFHDCIDGCDACLNFDQPGNRKLKSTVDSLETVYVNYNKKLSRADFWSLAGKQALVAGRRQNNEVFCKSEYAYKKNCRINEVVGHRFLYGRDDCPTSPHSTNIADLPDPRMGSKDLYAWFKKVFNFNPNVVVSLMGAHTLGRAGGQFSGTWEPHNVDGLSNGYFRTIANEKLNWTDIDASTMTGKKDRIIQWVGQNGPGFALNVDIALFRRIWIKNYTTGDVGCTYYTCGKRFGQRPATWGMFMTYVKIPDQWMRTFRGAFQALTQVTKSKLYLPNFWRCRKNC